MAVARISARCWLVAMQARAEVRNPSRTSQRSSNRSISKRKVSIVNSRSSDIPSLPRRSPVEHRADLGAAVAAIPRPEARLSLWRRIIRAAQALDDSWWGDALGAVLLFVFCYGMFVIAGVLG